MLANEPGRFSMIAAAGRCRQEHLERQLRQRARRHNLQLLAFDDVFHLTEQRLVEPVRADMVEGQREDALFV